MYTREISELPENIIKNGKAVFGTFEGCPKKLDIRGIRAPFSGFPLPTVITNFRIRSSLSFMFSIGNYIGIIDVFDQKVCGLVDVVFWNKETKRKFAYKKILGPRRRFIPHEMHCGFFASLIKNRYVRLSWDRARNRFSVIFYLKGDSSRPSARAAFIAPYMDECMNEVLTVTPFPTRRRCSATYIATPSIHGSLTVGKTKNSPAVTMEDTDGFAIFRANRAYYNLEYETESVIASGIVEINGTKKRISFVLKSPNENQVEADKFNPNFMFLDGKKTPLPQVRITHTAGMFKTWVIQDFENMVDLTFTPSAKHQREISMLAINTNTTTIYGTFEGVMKTSENEDIALHNFEGLVRSKSIRS